MSRRLAAAILASAASLGAGPGLWEHPAPGGLPGGTPSDIALSADGSLILAPASEEILPGKEAFATPPLLLSVATDVEGNTYFGGGLGARVLRVNEKGEIHTFFESSGLGVRALSADVSGYLLVATLPNGRVYRVDADGNTEVFLEPEVRYLWAMATDAFDRTYLATGEQGIIYTISGPGEATVFFDSDESHITSLATDPGGMLLAGSSGRGLLYRIPAEGRAEVILNSGLSEISSIAVASDGTVYASAILDPGPLRPRKRREGRDELTIEVSAAGEDEVLEEATEHSRKVVIDLGEVLPAAEEAAKGAASRVYRVSPGRTPRVLWNSPSERVYSLALDSRGHLLMGTGPSGRLYRVEPDGSATLLRQYPATHVTSLAAGPKGETWVLTSNPGRAYRMEPVQAESGTYLSTVHDAGNVAAWGTLRWEADVPKGTRIAFTARSGNTAFPDETWSGWSETMTDASGSALQTPPSRYIQWRATLSRLKTETTPVLRSAAVTYLPENLPPEIRGVHVSSPGPSPAGSAKAGDREEESRKEGRSGEGNRLVWIGWSSSDPDGDPLSHTISIRRQEEPSWMPLARDVEGQRISLDPSGHPEGVYVARVVADDGKTNGNRRGLQASARSSPFVVDNTPPEIVAEEPSMGEESFTLSFSATDRLSPLTVAEWAMDAGGPWSTVLPRDGISDTTSESFDLSLPLEGMSRQIHIRVSDRAGNRSIREITLPRWQ